MSILLEALRKSEKDQQAPEVPDIHKDDLSSHQADPIRTGPLAVLLVLALFLGGWFFWNQYRPPEGVYQPPVTLASGDVSPAATPAQSPATVESDVESSQPTASGTGSDDGRPRTPVESYQEASKNVATTPPANTSPVIKPAKQEPVAKISAKKGGRPAVKPAKKEQVRAEEPAPISYWELPDAIRENVPEIKFSVLVYAKNAEDRFVLINGQRMGEGDTVQPGLEVKDIRRDGVVFSYRLYQFLVER